MRDYGKVSPQFWIGKTGKELRRAGYEAQLVSVYLLTSPHANMIGLYYMPLMYIAHETGLGIEGASKGLQRAVESGFCYYDDKSEMVWVPEMAAHQIGVQLSPKDKRCAGVQNEYNAQPENPFLPMFYEKYREDFHMSLKRSESEGRPRGIEGAFKGLGSQEQEQEQEQEKEQDKSTMSDSNRTADENASHGQEPPAPENPDSESGELAGGAGKSDPVETAFEEIFWGAGLRKDAKVKAKNAFRTKFTAWKKTTRGSADEFAQMLADDIRLRVQAKTFGFDKLLPTSYLNGERWNDEKPQVAAQPGAAGARPLVQQGANQVFVDYDALRAGGR